MPEELTLYNVYHTKVAYEDRDVAAKHLRNKGRQLFFDSYAEDAAEGEEGRYSALLTEEGYNDYLRASNLRAIEPARRTRKVGEKVFATVEFKQLEALRQIHGVERAALWFSGFEDPDNPPRAAAVCVADTGTNRTSWTEGRLLQLWNFTDSHTVFDVDGHGTWCLHAALGKNGQAISAKVLGDDGSGWDSWIMAGVDRFITWCRTNNRNGILTASLGSDFRARGYEEVGARAMRNGVLCLAAAGNDGYRDRISYPAAEPSWVAVGATNHRFGNGQMANFSNRRPPLEPNIYAPGSGVAGQGEGFWSGTSMATPIVARSAAEIIALVGVGPIRTREALVKTTRARDNHHGVGIMDHGRALALATERWSQ